ncbi:hypothetical protein [Xylanibacter rodentium]|uniref:hypothetical protein n=1 Tax=Xylanibacter rodentium TaxID=2736289 RepID=UPI00259CC400|nr:hypothetical protein [Xylanibacter rodentium]
MDYLLHGISWGEVLRMMIDAPGIDDKGKGSTTPGTSGGDDTEIALTDDNAEQLMNLINSRNR